MRGPSSSPEAFGFFEAGLWRIVRAVDPAAIWAITAILLFAGASFFFALAETALLSLGAWRVRQIAEHQATRGALVARLLATPQDLLATIVLGNTFAVAGMLAVALWMALDGRWPLTLTVLGVLLLSLIGGEVLPKTLAVRRAEHWALRVARPMALLQAALRPLRHVAQQANSALLKALLPARTRPQHELTDGEYRELLDLAFQQGTLRQSERDIILQIISLDRKTAREVMRPRSQMAAVSDELTMEQMVEAARKHRHQRLPIYDESPDTIVGLLNTRALLLDPQADMSEVMEFPSFVPETMNLLQLLKSLQRQRRGLAIVLDEFGGTAGLVTAEDILGELVGGIRAEHATEGFVMEKLGPGRWRVNGTMRIEDFRREHPALGEIAEVETLGGLMCRLLDAIPAVGETVNFRGLKLTARLADERRVRELLVEVGK